MENLINRLNETGLNDYDLLFIQENNVYKQLQDNSVWNQLSNSAVNSQVTSQVNKQTI